MFNENNESQITKEGKSNTDNMSEDWTVINNPTAAVKLQRAAQSAAEIIILVIYFILLHIK